MTDKAKTDRVSFTVVDTVIENGERLLKAIAQFGKVQQGWNKTAHMLACSAFFHAAKYGSNCPHLNALAKILNVNDLTALRAWAGNAATSVKGEGDDAEEVTWLTYSKAKGFQTKSGEDFKNARAGFIEAGGTEKLVQAKPFYVKDVSVREMSVIDIKWLIGQMQNAVDKAKKGDVAPDGKRGGGQKVEIPAEILAIVEKTVMTLENKAIEYVTGSDTLQ
jgi:hypothetical protein